MNIKLTASEQNIVRHIAEQRQKSNRQGGVTNKKVGGQSDDITDLNGFGGELAFCKAMNLYPDLDIVPGGGEELADATLIDGRRVDVKTSPHPKANLVARKIQGDIELFILVRGNLPDYELIGYATREELIAAPKRDLGWGDTHFLSASDLHPTEDLIQVQRGRLP